MKNIRKYLLGRLVAGLLIVVPLYLSILLLLKAMSSVSRLVEPISHFFPDWLPAEHLMALLLVLSVCFLVGMLVWTPAGQAVRERIERSLFERIPEYSLLRGLTKQVTGESLDIPESLR